MNRSDAIVLFEQSEAYINLFLNEIKKDNANIYLFIGKPRLRILETAENVSKVIKYTRVKNEPKLYQGLLNLRLLTIELQRLTHIKGYGLFASDCRRIIRASSSLSGVSSAR